MKKVILSLLLATGMAVFANAQNAPTNVVKVNPLGFVFGSANVAYEKALTPKTSFVIAPSFGAFKLGGFKYSSYGLGAEYRFYLSKTSAAPEGFYAAPGVGFTAGRVKEDESNSKVKFTSFGGKAVIGNQWIFKSGFTLDLNGGVQFNSFSYKDNNGDFVGLKASGVFPALGFSIGYAF
jgi:hypothetical protein